MSKILVTGGAGFIGSHIVDALVGRKHFVRVLDNFSSGKKDNLSGSINQIELIRGDIRDKAVCRKAARSMDYIIHQAALRSVPKSLANPEAYNQVNIGGTLNLLQAAVENKIKAFVFASSSSVYGDVDKFPEREDFLPQPISPYALTKLTGEHYCKIFSLNYKIATVALRYFNVFGPRQSLDDEYAVVIPKFIHCIFNDRPTPIYGNGRQSRDFTYVANVVSANLAALKLGNSRGQVFNVASGRDYSVLELAAKLNKILGKGVGPKFLPVRPGDVFRTSADLGRSKKILKFKPRVDFPEGLKLACEYFRKIW